jgi:hypothetical protein
MFIGHKSVNKGTNKFTRGCVHYDVDEYFNAILELTKLGILYYISKRHL